MLTNFSWSTEVSLPLISNFNHLLNLKQILPQLVSSLSFLPGFAVCIGFEPKVKATQANTEKTGWGKCFKIKTDACQSLYLTFEAKTYINIGLKFHFGDGITIGFGLDFYLPVLEVWTSKSQIKLFTHAQY